MSFGGKFDYAKEYGKYKPKVSNTKFESYVDSHPDLKAAWASIESDPAGTQGSYWKPRGATSKAAFGRAHAAESGALKSGTYHGGTDVKPSKGKTRFESWLSSAIKKPGDDKDNGAKPPWDDPGNKQNKFHPMLVPEYEAPEAISGIPLDYQPWTSDYQQQYVPENIWNYTPPQLTVGRPQYTPPSTGLIDVNRPEYQPKATVKPPLTHLPEGAQTEGYQDPYPGMIDPTWGTDASNPYASPDYNAAANAAIAAQIQAMQDIAEDDYMDSSGVVDTTGLGFDIGEIDPGGYYGAQPAP
tara:strand:+ start:1438 stop:2331 length:894 start_codon:yes stop_codon:yes gene_type:complete